MLYKNIISQLSKNFNSGKLAFFVGAGISVLQPSCLPTGRGLVEHFIDLIADNEEIGRIIKSQFQYIRPERIFSTVSPEIWYPSLKVLQSNKPNLNHYILAMALKKGCIVLTTNFDTLIEQAAQDLNIDFSIYNPYLDDYELKKEDFNGCLVKLHGTVDFSSKGDPIVIGRIEDVVLGLNPHSVEILLEIFKKYSLLVLGYSGADDFSFQPFFMEKKSKKGIYWLKNQKSNTRFVPPDKYGDNYGSRIIKSQNEGEKIGNEDSILLEGHADSLLQDLLDNSDLNALKSLDIKAKCVEYIYEQKISDEMRLAGLGKIFTFMGVKEAAVAMFITILSNSKYKYLINANDKFSAKWIDTLNTSQIKSNANTFHPFYDAVIELGDIYHADGRYKDAWALFQAGLRKARDDLKNGEYLTEIARLLIHCGIFTYNDATIPFTDYGPSFFINNAIKVCDLVLDLGGRTYKALALSHKGEMLRKGGKYEESSKSLLEAIQLYEMEYNYYNAFEVRASYALLLHNAKKYDESIRENKLLLDFFEKCNDPFTIAKIKGNMGFSYAAMGKIKKGISCIERGLEEMEKWGSPAESYKMSAYKRLAILYWNNCQDDKKALFNLNRYLSAYYHVYGPLYGDTMTLELSWIMIAIDAVESGNKISEY